MYSATTSMYLLGDLPRDAKRLIYRQKMELGKSLSCATLSDTAPAPATTTTHTLHHQPWKLLKFT